MGRSKYKNRKVSYDGFTFDSDLERRRYVSLRRLESMGRIANLEVHPRFMLEGKNGPLINPTTNRRVGNYTADFKYLELGRDGIALAVVVEDVKSPSTAALADYKIRKALLKDNHPNIDFREVKKADVHKGEDE